MEAPITHDTVQARRVNACQNRRMRRDDRLVAARYREILRMSVKRITYIFDRRCGIAKSCCKGRAEATCHHQRCMPDMHLPTASDISKEIARGLAVARSDSVEISGSQEKASELWL